MLRVMVVDDQEDFRELARLILDSSPEFQVVAEASSGTQALREVETARPDLVLMDVQMDEMNGIEATRQLQQQQPEIKVVLVSMCEENEYARLARDAGALAFVAKRRLSPYALRQLLDTSEGPSS